MPASFTLNLRTADSFVHPIFQYKDPDPAPCDEKVAHNDYEIVNSIQGDDELTAVFSDLKTTVEKLKRNEAQIYETQIRQQMIRIKVMKLRRTVQQILRMMRTLQMAEIMEVPQQKFTLAVE